jgi:hypothetical protein
MIFPLDIRGQHNGMQIKGVKPKISVTYKVVLMAWDLKAKGVYQQGTKQGLDVFGHELKIPQVAVFR